MTFALHQKKCTLTSDILDNSSTDQYSAIKSKILNSIDKINNKKRADLNAITDYILKTKASNLDKTLLKQWFLNFLAEI